MPGNFLVFIASRPEAHIREAFAKWHGSEQEYVLHNVEDAVVQRDIDTFLRHRLADLKEGMTETAYDGDVPGVAKDCGHIFLYANEVVRFVKHLRGSGPLGAIETSGQASTSKAKPLHGSGWLLSARTTAHNIDIFWRRSCKTYPASDCDNGHSPRSPSYTYSRQISGSQPRTWHRRQSSQSARSFAFNHHVLQVGPPPTPSSSVFQ